MNTATNLFGNVIFAYTREQAINDGELVDVSERAKKSGFTIPLAVTRATWNQYIEWTTEDSDKQTHQDQRGRLNDVLWMLYLACKQNKNETFIHYKLLVVPRDGHSRSPVLTRLKAVIGGGDAGEPVITIMLTNED